ncbi:MAG: MBL fold metallo-hydrolase [Candidatus Lokiarchaeota archaeon]|nr:MBL fold metallo-hydrolase [Candidatus Lokiarchaeota archaeon]
MKEVIKNIYHVCDSGCSVFLVNTKSNDGLVLIDAGMDSGMISRNLKKIGLDPSNIKHCIITHCHIDHIAACHDLLGFNKNLKFYAHDLDAEFIEEKGFDSKTAASWYDIKYEPVKLEAKFKKDKEVLRFGSVEFECIHTPGHTPGSISVLIIVDSTKVLFGQDIHGPFNSEFGSNLYDYQNSMQKLLDLKADILCEGHFGIIQPAKEVKRYIRDYKDSNIP